MHSAAASLEGRRILVTGGGGFIGGRLVERLFDLPEVRVRVMGRNLSHAARAARYPVELVLGDVCSRDDVARAVAGCDLVFHCAVGVQGSEKEQRRTTVDGTKNVLAAARLAGGVRVVHVSTVDVYGHAPDGDLRETDRRRYLGNVYADGKLDAERSVLEAARRHGQPVVVVQPTVVYGPFGQAWTVRLLNEMAGGRVILVDGGEGLCNAVYVDDVVEALLLAAVRDEALGECFLISAAEPVAWKGFYRGFESILGKTSTVELAAGEARRLYRERQRRLVPELLGILRDERELRSRVFRTREMLALTGLVRRLLPDRLEEGLETRLITPRPAPAERVGDKPVVAMHPDLIRRQTEGVRVRIDKARDRLGYRPVFDLDRGMARVASWARWANLVPASREPTPS